MKNNRGKSVARCYRRDLYIGPAFRCLSKGSRQTEPANRMTATDNVEHARACGNARTCERVYVHTCCDQRESPPVSQRLLSVFFLHKPAVRTTTNRIRGQSVRTRIESLNTCHSSGDFTCSAIEPCLELNLARRLRINLKNSNAKFRLPCSRVDRPARFRDAFFVPSR